MKKTGLISAILAVLMCMTSCTQPTQNDIPKTEENEAEIIAEPAEERTELWISLGKTAYDRENSADFDTAAYFSEKSPVNTVLALSDDMYFHEPEAYEAVAAQVYAYIVETYGEDALYDLDKRVQYKDEWIKTVDVSLSYQQNTLIEKTLARITASSSDDFAIIAELDGTEYCFYGYDSSITPYLAHSFLYYNAEALSLLRDELIETDLDGLVFDTEAPIRYVMDFSGNTVRLPDGSYSIGRYEDLLSSAVLMMSSNADPDALWITEGLAEIYGKARGYFFYTVYDRVFYLHPSTAETLRAYADAGEAVGVYHTALSEYYYKKGGTLEQENIPEEFSHIADYRFSIDGELYTHASALANMGCEYLPRLGSLTAGNFEGSDLSKAEAGSFVLWLTEKFGIDAVLAACHDYEKFVEIFGVSYDALEDEWLDRLEEMFE